ncbi:hypothetical protein BH11ARM2_BH11ARM2_02280 [soil metagenome]
MLQGRTVCGLVCLLGIAHAQIPDVRVRVDVGLTARALNNARFTTRLYDPFGRPSIVALSLYLEPGFRFYVGQRLEGIPGGPQNLLDEAYLENEGDWRIGRQYLPFGTGKLIAESANAVRADTNLIFEGLPVSFAAFDNGKGYAQGYNVRIGAANLGASAAFGNSIGASGTSLGVVRYPGDAPGRGRGWRVAVGAHAQRRLGRFDGSLEAVLLRNGETALDDDLSVLDFSLGYRLLRRYTVVAGYSRAFEPHQNFYRLTGVIPIEQRVSLEPLVRFRNGGFYDLALTVRVRF